MNISRSANPEVAIALGSVLYSMSHNIISPRKAKYTFGIRVREKWDNIRYSSGGNKIYDELDKVDECENIFSKFITKGDNLRPDEVIEKSYTMCASKVSVELYRTEEKDVIFCDQKNDNNNLIVWKFGEFIIDVGNDFDYSSSKMRKAIVKMKVGGTYITSWAIYCKTNKKVEMTCLFE